MIQIAPLLPQSQPTAQTANAASSNQGSESVFGKILGQKISSEKSTSNQPAVNQNKPGKKAQAAAENDQQPDTQNTPQVLGTTSESVSAQTKETTTAGNQAVAGTPNGNENATDVAAIGKSPNSTQILLNQQDFALEEIIADISNGAKEAPAKNAEDALFAQNNKDASLATTAKTENKTVLSEQSGNNGQALLANGQTVVDNRNVGSATAGSAPSSQGLWPANASLTGNETITISGYFPANKSQQSPLPLIDETAFPPPLQEAISGTGTDAEQNASLPSTAVIRNPTSLAGQKPLAMTDNSELRVTTQPTYTTRQTETETAPLMVTLNQLTSLKPQHVDVQDKYRPLANEPLRQQFQELQQQIKAEAKSSEGSDNTDQQFNSKQETAATTLTQNLQNSTTSTTSPSLSFSEVSQTAIAATQAQPSAPLSQPLSPTAPLSPIVHDNGLVQQVAENLQLQIQNQETRVKIQLQPAELGKLDINLSVKDGSIKAHVIAQSGQVQELLEKNMAKLKGVLESQGFSIEEILVSTASETIGHSGLFQDQTTQHQHSAGTKSQFSDTRFGDSAAGFIAAGAETVTSVNITA